MLIGGEGTALPCRGISINTCRRNDGNRKLPLGKHGSNNYCRQVPSIDAEISEQKYGEKQDICMLPEHFPHKMLINY